MLLSDVGLRLSVCRVHRA